MEHKKLYIYNTYGHLKYKSHHHLGLVSALRALAEPRVYLHELEYSINELTSTSIFPVDFHLELILAQKH
jgi:hypothetical protein